MLNKEALIQKFKEYCSFVIGQEELSDRGFSHIEIFLTTKNNYTYMAMRKNLYVPYVKPVDPENIQREIDYCMKVDSRVLGGESVSIGARQGVDTQDFWHRFLDLQTISEGLYMVKEEKPLDYIKLFPKLQAALVNQIGLCAAPKYDSNWVIPKFEFLDRTLIFIGPTNFALSHFDRPLHATNRQDFEKLGPTKFNYDGVVMDDLPLHKWDLKELIALTDLNFTSTINIKYSTGVLKSGLRRIICSNELDQVDFFLY